jgi:hypothetical protein
MPVHCYHSNISSHMRGVDIGFIMVGIWQVALCAVVIQNVQNVHIMFH